MDSLSAAVGEAKHEAYSASTYLRESPAAVWVDESGNVMEVFDSGLSVLSQTPQFGDPVAYYKSVVATSDRLSVYLTDVNGSPALAVEPNTDKLTSNPGLVRFEAGDLSIVISGPDMSVSQLVPIAEGVSGVSYESDSQ